MDRFKDEKATIKKNLNNNKKIYRFFPEDFFSKELKKDRINMHKIMYYCRKERNIQILLESMQCIEKSSFITSFQSKLIKQDFNDSLSELIVCKFLVENFGLENITYEPITNGRKKLDFKVSTWTEEYYIEVKTIKDEKKVRDIDEMVEGLVSKIEKLDLKGKIISFNLWYDFWSKDINSFLEFIKENLNKWEGEYIFRENTVINTKFSISPIEGEGFVGIYGWPGFWRKVKRIDHAIKSYMESWQFLEHSKNILIINIIARYFHKHELDYLYGETVYYSTDELGGRSKFLYNGLLTKESAKKMWAIIYFQNNDFEHRNILPNHRARNRISNDVFDIFTTQ